MSQISCIRMIYNIIIQKTLRRTPRRPLGGRKRGNLRENLMFFTVFCINMLQFIQIQPIWDKTFLF